LLFLNLFLSQVLDLDEKNQILKSLVWFRMQWEDEQLKWNPDEFEGLKESMCLILTFLTEEFSY